MSSPLSNKRSSQTKYIPADNFYMTSLKSFTFGSIGLILGIAINNAVVFIANTLKMKTAILQIIMQLIVCSTVLAGIHHFYNYFGHSWQNVTEGLFFISFLFGVQFNLYTNVQNAYISTFDKSVTKT